MSSISVTDSFIILKWCIIFSFESLNGWWRKAIHASPRWEN